MASGIKHFSHNHNLLMHEMPEGAEVSCSGCNSSATKTIYICWQCNFYLHEQCFHATRSRKHPSHPQHPLNLLPYPTYPSNSFYCNSCKVIGTGFSYSCSDCDFDLHVQCAYSISDATNSHQHPVTSPQPHHVSYPDQAVAPTVPNVPSISFPTPIPIPTPIPTPTPIPVPAQYSISMTQDPYMAQNVSTFSVPAPIPIPTTIPIPTPIPVPAQYPINVTQDSYMAQNVSTFVPTSAQNLVTSAQNAHIPQSFTSVPTSAHNSSIPQHLHTPFASVPPTAPNSQPPHYGESGKNKTTTPGIKHFSHPHGLVLVNIKHGKKNITCSGCQETLIGKGYACAEQNCSFQLDESCFNLEKEIQHKSHPAHPLTLLSSSLYKNQNGRFTCNACYKDGSGFNYHCSICEHDLHVKCANLSETVKRDDHEHVLKLFYEAPLMGEEYTFFCDVCSRVVHKDHWTYYCKECDFGTHLECVNRQVCDESSGDQVDDSRTDQERLDEAYEIARINALGRKYSLENI
ncbi:putative chromatin regulator PHD family [Helianthus annuus]|uniref:Chromatin regulator PHD family n=1 Tax=Helianthus annuus TaxID=4232 RepID=A0A251S0S9_HELAN|nr:uncharacterized protein LOC110915531 [Helianthus annuus]XP_022016870.1 uncharacterized protein LOC110916437 [Helianthus annuus]KAF5760976.1 putative chromatin regulator PHD family [Helianthus annuus]KAF5760980.1 putative chromatin regulator PHD family [Helianthus annuus]KAJ0438910.1 putative chromatin regulator PHD family [Helianthus annuus]KAJ0438913.1 putative chromatin regulator PHD family [Helianthus annuus]KAJ0443849.1 putative chromatin regulator PHD family [Helianthus annuus]